MKLQVQIENTTKDVEIKRDDRRVYATVDGREYDLEISEPEPNVYLLKHEASIYEAYLTWGAGGVNSVEINNSPFDIRVIDPKRLRGSVSGEFEESGLAEIKTAMPGKVVRIVAQPGMEIKKGDGVVVVEAMKMQNELKSPRDGSVRSLNAVVGGTVAAGDVLAVIE